MWDVLVWIFQHIAGVVAAIAIIAVLLNLWIEHRDRTPDQEAQHLYGKFNDRFGQLPFSEWWALRRQMMAMATLRREASQAALNHPAGTEDAIRRIAAREAEALARAGHVDLAKNFLSVVGSSTNAEILYKDARAAVLRHAMTPTNLKLTDEQLADHIASLRILRA